MASDILDSLTDKQAEALVMVLRRMSSKEIARELGISPWSVDKRLDAARVKLGAQTREEAARIYARARYGESFAGEPFAVTPAAELVEPEGGASSERAAGDRESQSSVSSGTDPWPTLRRSVLWLDPKAIGPVGRLALILGGALAISLLLLSGLGIANGLQSLLAP